MVGGAGNNSCSLIDKLSYMKNMKSIGLGSFVLGESEDRNEMSGKLIFYSIGETESIAEMRWKLVEFIYFFFWGSYIFFSSQNWDEMSGKCEKLFPELSSIQLVGHERELDILACIKIIKYVSCIFKYIDYEHKNKDSI